MNKDEGRVIAGKRLPRNYPEIFCHALHGKHRPVRTILEEGR